MALAQAGSLAYAPLSDDWTTLKQRVTAFLDQFAFGSNELLHYVGLLPI